MNAMLDRARRILGFTPFKPRATEGLPRTNPSAERDPRWWVLLVLLIALAGVDGILLHRILRPANAPAPRAVRTEAVGTSSSGGCDGVDIHGRQARDLCAHGAIVFALTAADADRSCELWSASDPGTPSPAPRVIAVCEDAACAARVRTLTCPATIVLPAAAYMLTRAAAEAGRAGALIVVAPSGEVLNRDPLPRSTQDAVTIRQKSQSLVARNVALHDEWRSQMRLGPQAPIGR